MSKNLTLIVKETLEEAQKIAGNHHNYQLDIPHVWSVLVQPGNFAYNFYAELNIDMNEFIQMINQEVNKISTLSGADVSYGEKQSQRLRKLLDTAADESEDLRDRYMTVEHLVIALFEQNFNPITTFLSEKDIDKDMIYKKMNKMRKGKQATSEHQETIYDSLNKYAVNLNQKYINGQMNQTIGRTHEIQDIIRILTRKNKNNAILIGDPGVGKTAIVEGLVQTIVGGGAPDNLKNKIIFNLDLSSLVAGTQYRGEFEEKLKAVLDEVRCSNNQVILFIDEIHTIVGMGQTEGSMDAGNIIKPMLARGDVRCIGATTQDEYRENIEKDKALERRFQRVVVHETPLDDTLDVLKGIRQNYEAFHEIKITDDAIEAAVKLSQRYMTDRFLPDKAIDLMDEACAVKYIQTNGVPESIQEINDKIVDVKIKAYKKENNFNTEEDALNMTKYLDALQAEKHSMEKQWEEELESLDERLAERKKLRSLNNAYKEALREEDIQHIVHLSDVEIPEVEHNIQSLNDQRSRITNDSNVYVNEMVTEEDIAKVVERLTGVKISGIMENERGKLLHLEEELHQYIIGQDEAVAKISQSVLRSRAGIQNPTKPTGSFLFLGPTGVGKTQLAKSLAQVLFGTELDMIRLDMSEYMERHAVARLHGPPPGYVGYDEGGQLTEAVRLRPRSIIVLDEIEKAHPDVFNLLLQVLDEGILTDSQGRAIDFKSTILIMTSNIGSSLLLDSIEENNTITEESENETISELRSHFKPEFLNRIDEVLLFNPLTKEQMYYIAELMVKQLNDRLRDKNMNIVMGKDVVKWLADNGYHPIYGARPLQRFISQEIETPLARDIIANDMTENVAIHISMDNGEPIFRYKTTK